MDDRFYHVYIMTNERRTVLYTGVTNDLDRRINEHKNQIAAKSFTTTYNVKRLIYYETFENVEEAISREKQIKAGSRKKKLALIESMNPQWLDLSESGVSTGLLRLRSQ